MFSLSIKQAGLWSSVALLLILSGCASVPERHPLPPEYTLTATIPGIPEARFWGDEWPKFGLERFETYTDADFRENFPALYEKPHAYLAISGGGSNGAFGAGLLLGWTATGTRPEFAMVTGVSTGALTAPFAFLGSDYDDELKTVYTTITTKDIVEKRGFIAAATGDSVADTAPLKRLIAKYITVDMIDAIGREHRKGRRLFIGTVNLDAGRSVIWSIGTIAASDHPQRVTLIREILRASAAIPVAFPPVVFEVEANGQIYDEMHVDGGTGSQVFVYPAAVDWRRITEKLKVQGEPEVYVIRNSFWIRITVALNAMSCLSPHVPLIHLSGRRGLVISTRYMHSASVTATTSTWPTYRRISPRSQPRVLTRYTWASCLIGVTRWRLKDIRGKRHRRVLFLSPDAVGRIDPFCRSAF